MKILAIASLAVLIISSSVFYFVLKDMRTCAFAQGMKAMAASVVYPDDNQVLATRSWLPLPGDVEACAHVRWPL